MAREEMPPNDSRSSSTVLESLADAKANRTGNFEVFTNGPNFYPGRARSHSRRQAQCLPRGLHLPQGEIGRTYVEALAERARAGVEINVTLDAFGSIGAGKRLSSPAS